MALMDRLRIDGKVAIVTGAGRGVGRGIALALAEGGATVVCSARTRSGIDDTVREITGHRARDHGQRRARAISASAACCRTAWRKPGSTEQLVESAQVVVADFVTSGAANNRPPGYLASYAASKAALASLVRSIAIEHGKDGIRCDGVPAGIRTCAEVPLISGAGFVPTG